MFLRSFRWMTASFLLMLALHNTPLQAQETNSFLYRISGNGLSKPSFLWGTIHLQNESLFNFPDSLYHYLESAEAFAMEIHPDSIAGKALDYYFKGKKRKTIGEMVDAQTLAQLKKKYQSKYKEPLENLTLTEAMMQQQSQSYQQAAGSKKMSTFMDMYLMTIAQSMGKEILGLERTEDQLKLLDDLLLNQDPAYVLGDFSSDKTTQQLIKAYLNTDMNAVRKFVTAMPAAVEEPFLSGRNKLMLQKMIPAMQQYSLFTAVGLAHLPGDQGLIQLLRKAGYKVDPVFSKQKIHASKYEPGSMLRIAKKKEADWETLTLPESGVSIQMPGKPTENDVKNSGMKMYMYIDWKENMYYYLMHVVTQVDINENNRDSMLIAAANGASKNTSGKEPRVLRNIEMNGLTGKEALFGSKDMQGIRLMLFNKEQDLYMLMVGAQDTAKIFNANAQRFAQSLRMLPKKAASNITYTDSEELFSIQFPGAPAVNPEGFSEPKDPNSHMTEKVLYKRPVGTSTELMVKVMRITEKGAFDNDQQLMQGIYENMQGMTSKESLQQKDTLWFNCPASIVSGKMDGGIQYELRMLKRGGRLYTLWYFDNQKTFNQEAKNDYFNSFALLPYPAKTMRTMTLDSITVGYFDSTARFANYWGNEDSTEIVAYHQDWATTMETKQIELKPAAWASSDSALLMTMVDDVLRKEKATLIKASFAKRQGLPMVEALLQMKESAAQLRIRLYKAGNKVYRQRLLGEAELLQQQSVTDWFNAFSLGKAIIPLDVTKNSPTKIFEQLRLAPDEETFTELVRGIDQLPYTKQELPLLLQEAAAKWTRDTSYPSLQNELWRVIGDLADSTTVEGLQKAYNEADANGNGQSKALRLLLKIGTNNALAFVQKSIPLTKEKEPSVGDFFGEFYQQPKLVEKLLPGWYKLVSDTTYGTAIVMMHKLAMDSNYAVQVPPTFQDDLLTLGRRMLARMQKDKDAYRPYMYGVILALGKLGTPEADALLFDYASKSPDTDYNGYIALKELMKHGVYAEEPVAKYSASPYWRSSIYSLMAEYDQLQLMPAKYRTQPMMAESYLYDNGDDYEIDTLIAAGERELMFMGKKYRFYVYKAGMYEDENNMGYYFAVSGPFALDKNNVVLQEEDVYVNFISEEPFDKKNIDKWLKEYLKSIEEEQAETDAPKEDE